MALLLRDLSIAAAGLLALALIPVFTDAPGIRDFIIFVIANGLLAMSLNLLIGYTGLVSFGHAIYFASGAYAFGLMMRTGEFSIPAAFLLAVLFTAALAAIVGAICVRLTEIYFAFLTLAFQMLLHSLILSWVDLTGGDQGLMGGIPRPPFLGIDLNDSVQFYWFACVVFIAALLVMHQITVSPFGYTLRLIRDNPQRANFLGINVVRMKLISFILSGTFASVGGILFAIFISGAYPDWAFWTKSGEAIFMIMLGGSTVFFGPLLGAAILHLLNDLVTLYTEYYGLVLGIVILLFVLGLRKGVLDVAMDHWGPRKRRTLAASVPAARDEPAQ